MTREDKLLDAFGLISDKYIEEASPENDGKRKQAVIFTLTPERRRRYLKIAAAACLTAAAAAAIIISSSSVRPVPSDDGQEGGVGMSFTLFDKTCGTFAYLPELAMHLRLHGTPDSGTAYAYEGKVISSKDIEAGSAHACAADASGKAALSKNGDYAYTVENGLLRITGLNGRTYETAGVPAIRANKVFVSGDTLMTVAQRGRGRNKSETIVRRYDVSDPAAPVLLDEYIQRGECGLCWKNGGELCLVTMGTGDARSDDKLDYYPSLGLNGERVVWDDGDVAILGDPNSLQYAAITVLDPATGGIRRKQALYGNIQRLFCGDDWFAAAAAAETYNIRDNPVLYTFDGDLNFTGSVSTAEITAVPEKNRLVNHELREGDQLSILSVEKYGDVFRMVGTRTVLEDGERGDWFIVAAADMRTGHAGTVTLSAEGYGYGSATRVSWKDDRVIVFVDDSIEGNDDRFTVPFDQLGIKDNGRQPRKSEETSTATTTAAVVSETDADVTTTHKKTDKTDKTDGTTAETEPTVTKPETRPNVTTPTEPAPSDNTETTVTTNEVDEHEPEGTSPTIPL